MKLIIAGSRSLKPTVEMIDDYVHQFNLKPLEIVSGLAKGVDTSAIHYAYYAGLLLKAFEADWDLYGRSAGYKRNAQMATYADALLAIWDGNSPGTRHMINLANEHGLSVHEVILSD